MSTNDTASNPTDWIQFYHRGLSAPPQAGRDTPAVSESIVVTTTATASSSAVGPEGRVGKSSRRRSRASRRAPTTLLNTDTSNFRAMVQQFTGAPTVPLSSGGGAVVSFGFGAQTGPPPVGAPPPPNYYYRHHQGYSMNDSYHPVFGGVRPSSEDFLEGLSSQMMPRQSTRESNNDNNGNNNSHGYIL